MNNMTVHEIFDAIDSGMKQIAQKLETGELDGAGRFWTEEELASGAASDARLTPAPTSKESAA